MATAITIAQTYWRCDSTFKFDGSIKIRKKIRSRVFVPRCRRRRIKG